MKDPDPRPSRIGSTSYMIKRTGNLTMSATGAFVVVDLYPWHFYTSSSKAFKVSGVGSPLLLQPRS